MQSVKGQYERAAPLKEPSRLQKKIRESRDELFITASIDQLDRRPVRERLGETNFNSALAEGRELTLEQAIELAASLNLARTSKKAPSVIARTG